MERIGEGGKVIGPVLYFLDDDLLRAPRLRADYSFPYLHSFLRLQRTTLTIWPQINRKPRQVVTENFMCLLSGVEEFKMISGVFKQNLYSGVYDDLMPGEIPEDIDFFSPIQDKYPLLQ